MKFKNSVSRFAVGLMLGVTLATTNAAAAPVETMMKPTPDAKASWRIKPVLTIGARVTGYTPPGVLDGLGAYNLSGKTVQILANHELGFTDGYGFSVEGRRNKRVTVESGSRISYFNIDTASLQIKEAGLAIKRIYNRNQKLVTDMENFDGTGRNAFSRFCSSGIHEPEQFGGGRGISRRAYITGEEDGGGFSEFGGGQWALNPENGDFWAVPAMGRGAWENVTEIDTGRADHVAFIMSDDTAPFVIDADLAGTDGDIPFNTDPRRNNQNDGAPLYLFVGKKSERGNFLNVNGLADGSLYVWVSNGPESVRGFNGTGSALAGRFEKVVNSGPKLGEVCPASGPDDPFGPVVTSGTQFGPNQDGFGYATQRCLWFQARRIHRAFQFSRPEDVATNPNNGSEFVLASTGREDEFGNEDQWGMIYKMDVQFEFSNGRPSEISGRLKIVYDANDRVGNQEVGYPSKDFGLRSADNLDWADDGMIYVQEDAAVSTFGLNSGREASIWQLDQKAKKLSRIAIMDRSVVLDPTARKPAFDQLAGVIGGWESSGILDVSKNFSRPAGSLLIFDVQAHGITDQNDQNPGSRITDDDLKEGGQLLFLQRRKR